MPEQSATDTRAAASPHAPSYAELGVLLLEAGFSATEVRDSLESVRDAHDPGLPLTFAVFPEAVIVSDAAATPVTALRVGRAAAASVHQSAMTSRMLQRLRAGELTLAQALDGGAARIRAAAPRHPVWRSIGGSALISLGLVLLFRCPWWAVAVAFGAGAVVGGLVAIMQRLPAAAAIAPFVAATVSTLLVEAIATGIGAPAVPLIAVCAPLAMMVPGALITSALLEITAADIVTGASRLVYGMILLGMMTAGIALGGALMRLPIDAELVSPFAHPAPVVWLGVVALALGVAVAFGAGWQLTLVSIAVMLPTFALLTALTPMMGSAIASGVTAVVLFVCARLIERTKLAVPASITFQPAFLLLVPGTVGLVALASSDSEALTNAPISFLALCLGIKIGAVITDTPWLRVFRRAARP